jgi:hypothetical protein
MPARYIQAIFKQYHLFTKSQEAQQAAAGEEMMEELEDGSIGGSPGLPASKNTSSEGKILNIREQQIKKIKESIAASKTGNPEEIYQLNKANKETNNHNSS